MGVARELLNICLFDACANRSLKIVVGLVSLVLISVFLLIPTADGNNEYIILRLALILFSLSIIYDQIDRYRSWNRASSIMRDIDTEISSLNNVPDNKLLQFFASYQVALSECPEIAKSVYEANREKLNLGWSHRYLALGGSSTDELDKTG